MSDTTSTLSFKIDMETIDMLRKLAASGQYTVFGQDENRKIFPIANISKCADCPDGWFEDLLMKLTQ